MSGFRGSSVRGLPYAECIIRVGDARPIVISLDELGGDVFVSPGTVDDMVHAEVVLGLMRAVVHSSGVVRQMAEDYNASEGQNPTGDGEPPF